MPEKLTPNYEFEREGRSLSDWLLDLVSEDRIRRDAAGEALGGMWQGKPKYSSDLRDFDVEQMPDIAGQMERFKEAIRKTLDTPEFPRRDFLMKLCLLQIALKQDWLNRVGESFWNDEKADEIEDRLIKQIVAAKDDYELEQSTRRFVRVLCSSFARDNTLFDQAESVGASGTMLHLVFEALDTALLAAREGLWAMLRYEPLYHCAIHALERTGPPAIEFSDYLIERLDVHDNQYGFDGAKALGSIAKNNSTVVNQLLSRLRDGSDSVRAGVCSVLTHIGPELAGRNEEALTLLLQTWDDEELVYNSVPALASVGRDDERALERLLQLAQPRPAIWKAYERHPEHQYDAVMYRRGVAIEALSYFQEFSDRVIAVLINAFDTFEEYDPDYQYDGEHVRVCEALGSFGPLAAPAVPRVMKYLELWLEDPKDKEWPKDALQLLEKIGPQARIALPFLHRLRNETCEADEIDDYDPYDPLDRAILAIGRLER